MAPGYITEQQEEEQREALIDAQATDAAIHIINGMTESGALARVEGVHHLREEAEATDHCIRDEDGYVESYLDSAIERPSSQGLNPKQIYAIKHKIIEQFQ